jgi:SnoaL-like polyketide cyclase
MSAEEIKAVLHREVEELYNHTGNLDVVEEIFSPDYVSHEPTSGEVRGIEGARQFAATFREAFPISKTPLRTWWPKGTGSRCASGAAAPT